MSGKAFREHLKREASAAARVAGARRALRNAKVARDPKKIAGAERALTTSLDKLHAINRDRFVKLLNWRIGSAVYAMQEISALIRQRRYVVIVTSQHYIESMSEIREKLDLLETLFQAALKAGDLERAAQTKIVRTMSVGEVHANS